MLIHQTVHIQQIIIGIDLITIFKNLRNALFLANRAARVNARHPVIFKRCPPWFARVVKSWSGKILFFFYNFYFFWGGKHMYKDKQV